MPIYLCYLYVIRCVIWHITWFVNEYTFANNDEIFLDSFAFLLMNILEITFQLPLSISQANLKHLKYSMNWLEIRRSVEENYINIFAFFC